MAMSVGLTAGNDVELTSDVTTRPISDLDCPLACGSVLESTDIYSSVQCKNKSMFTNVAFDSWCL